MNTQTRFASKTAQLLAIPFLVACAVGASGCGAIGQSATLQVKPTAIATAAATATGGFIDHSVVLNAPEVPSPNQASLSVAAYDD